MIVGVCRLHLALEGHSLKEKRMVLRRIKDRTRQRFNVAIAEVGPSDAWQRAQIAFAVVANDRRFVEGLVEKIVGFVEGMAVAKLIGDDRDLIQYGDDEAFGDDGFEV